MRPVNFLIMLDRPNAEEVFDKFMESMKQYKRHPLEMMDYFIEYFKGPEYADNPFALCYITVGEEKRAEYIKKQNQQMDKLFAALKQCS